VPKHPDWVEWRLTHGSNCKLCPLKGKRKVGCDGPPTSKNIIIAEAPGEKEEQFLSGKIPYGRPLVGPSGWAAKTKLLAPAGLCVVDTSGKWDQVKRLDAFLMNVIMCRPPDNKINSREGRRAIACCRNSALALVKHLISLHPQNDLPVISTFGATSLELLTGHNTVAGYRGRPVLQDSDGDWTLLTDDEQARIALRGVKPPEAWLAHEKVVKALIVVYRRTGKKIRNRPPTEAAPYLLALDIVVKKMRATHRKKLKLLAKLASTKAACDAKVSNV